MSVVSGLPFDYAQGLWAVATDNIQRTFSC